MYLSAMSAAGWAPQGKKKWRRAANFFRRATPPRAAEIRRAAQLAALIASIYRKTNT